MALNSKRILRITIAMACFEALFLKAPPLTRSPKTPYEDIYISLWYTCPADKQKNLAPEVHATYKTHLGFCVQYNLLHVVVQQLTGVSNIDCCFLVRTNVGMDK